MYNHIHCAVCTIVLYKSLNTIIFPLFITDARLEDWTLTKLNRPKPVRSNTHYLFSAELTRAAQSFGESTQYGEIHVLFSTCSTIVCLSHLFPCSQHGSERVKLRS